MKTSSILIGSGAVLALGLIASFIIKVPIKSALPGTLLGNWADKHPEVETRDKTGYFMVPLLLVWLSPGVVRA